MKLKLLVFMGGLALFAAGCASLPKSDLALLQGHWEGHGGSPAHVCSFVMTGNNFDFRDQTETNVWYKGTFTLREDTTPRRFLATVRESPFEQYIGKTSMAIYAVSGDKLTIAGNEPGNPEPPKSFEDPEAAKVELTRK